MHRLFPQSLVYTYICKCTFTDTPHCPSSVSAGLVAAACAHGIGRRNDQAETALVFDSRPDQTPAPALFESGGGTLACRSWTRVRIWV